MRDADVTPESLGREVLGPIVAEFCLRLWSLGSLLDNGGDTGFLFCARGGLRLQLAYDRFLSASGLSSPTHVAPLMVSRVVAMRSALMRTVSDGQESLVPSAAATLSYEFPRASVAEVALWISGVAPARTQIGRWDAAMTPESVAALLRHPDGIPVVAALRDQAGLFARHLHDVLGGRQHALLVDTGLYGTTRRLLADGFPDLRVSSALMALSHPPAGSARPPGVCGLSVEGDGYSPFAKRTALFRYWHFIEWLFEPELPSVKRFRDGGGGVRSDLEVDGWRDRVEPTAGTVFAGVMSYIEGSCGGPAQQVVLDSRKAWGEFRTAVVWPRQYHAEALAVGLRSHDFGRDEQWAARPWAGPVAALHGATMWREGEIARARTPFRRPLLAAIEMAYTARYAKWVITRLVNRRRTRHSPGREGVQGE